MGTDLQQQKEDMGFRLQQGNKPAARSHSASSKDTKELPSGLAQGGGHRGIGRNREERAELGQTAPSCDYGPLRQA